MYMLDKFGRLAYIESVSGSISYGVMLGGGMERGLDSALKIKVVNAGGEEILECADKVKIDGETFKRGDNSVLNTKMFDSDKKVVKQLIKYTQNNDGSGGYMSIIKLLSDGRIQTGINANHDVGMWVPGRWYRATVVVDASTSPAKYDMYLNGELKVSQANYSNIKFTTFRSLAEPKGTVEDGNLVAMDDLHAYEGIYDPEDELINLIEAASGYYVNKMSETIITPANITVADLKASIIAPKALEVYTDSTCTQVASPEDLVTPQMQIVATSRNSKAYAYYNAVSVDNFADIVVTDYDFSSAAKTINVPNEVRVSTFMEKTVFFDGNFAQIVDKDENVLDYDDVITEGSKLVIYPSQGMNITEYDFILQSVTEDFENWNVATVYSPANKSVPGWSFNHPSTETAQSTTAQAVVEEGRGKVLKMWSKGLTDNSASYNHTHLGKSFGEGALGEKFVLESDVKVAENSSCVITSKYVNTKGTDSFFEFVRINANDNQIVMGGERTPLKVDTWYRVSVVVDLTGGFADMYLDGVKLTSMDLQNVRYFSEFRLQQFNSNNEERIVYFDNFQIRILSLDDPYDLGRAFSTEIRSNEYAINIRDSKVHGVIGKTANEFLNKISLQKNSVAYVVDANGEEVGGDTPLTSDMALKVISADKVNTTYYTLTNEPWFKKIEFINKATGKQVTVIGQIEANDTLVAKTIASNYAETPFEATLYVAYYENSVLTNVKMQKVNVSGSNVEISAEINVPSTENVKVKAMLFKDMMPLTGAEEI